LQSGFAGTLAGVPQRNRVERAKAVHALAAEPFVTQNPTRVAPWAYLQIKAVLVVEARGFVRRLARKRLNPLGR
jgi:hypothetical protein